MGDRRGWGRRRLRARTGSWGCSSHGSQSGEVLGRLPQARGRRGWQAAVEAMEGERVSRASGKGNSSCWGHPPRKEDRERVRMETRMGSRTGTHHRTGPCAARTGGHRPTGPAGFAGCRLSPAASSAWSPGVGTCPGAVVACAPWAAGEKLLPLSWVEWALRLHFWVQGIPLLPLLPAFPLHAHLSQV